MEVQTGCIDKKGRPAGDPGRGHPLPGSGPGDDRLAYLRSVPIPQYPRCRVLSHLLQEARIPLQAEKEHHPHPGGRVPSGEIRSYGWAGKIPLSGRIPEGPGGDVHEERGHAPQEGRIRHPDAEGTIRRRDGVPRGDIRKSRIRTDRRRIRGFKDRSPGPVPGGPRSYNNTKRASLIPFEIKGFAPNVGRNTDFRCRIQTLGAKTL